ncbi:MAG TPA: hypothetical protein EYG89_01060 [Bacteroidia bacterium]|nr:hypothetical protein [Bacteroidia bacterium]
MILIKKKIHDIVYNPKNYFYYKSHKFISLKNIKEYKLERSESKDIKDLQMIDELLSNMKSKITIKYIFNSYLNFDYLKGRVKFILLKMRYNLVKLKNAIKN